MKKFQTKTTYRKLNNRFIPAQNGAFCAIETNCLCFNISAEFLEETGNLHHFLAINLFILI
ncbi:hypothetical protein DERP_008616 [Dermatophagoides pteronyssinus]|uniref:Uncharacterized protein n=1 Tax=Dermatophagoides pteronyssinus TaxID=6956 RepID=A0ABQ8IWT9_DERPT|nr:hypothetical protein DERP_008616 [Dermatophagoides pteronyssinus]